MVAEICVKMFFTICLSNKSEKKNRIEGKV